jgi:hypothetical protein
MKNSDYPSVFDEKLFVKRKGRSGIYWLKTPVFLTYSHK